MANVGPNARPRARGEERKLPRLELLAAEPWTEIGEPPADCSYSEFGRSLVWVVFDYLGSRGEPRDADDRLDRAIRAARIGLLDTVYGREDLELAHACGFSVRSVRRARADLRAALIRVGRQLPEPRRIPREFE